MNKKSKVKINIIDTEFQERIYNGILGPKEANQIIKKIKRKYS